MSLRDWFKDIAPSKVSAEGGSTAPRAFQAASLPPAPVKEGFAIENDGLSKGTPDILSVNAGSQLVRPVSGRALKSLPRNIRASRGPRAQFFDPLSLVYATGFRERRFSLTYDTLRHVSYQLSLVGSIIHTRVNQVSAFAQPYRENRQVGFQVRFKDAHYLPTEAERRFITELEGMIQQCGFGENPLSIEPRDDFETFLKKITRDSLTYDQLAFEVIPDHYGRPWEFRAVDASTIRLAATYDGARPDGKIKNFKADEFSDRWKVDYGDDFEIPRHSIYTVQVIHGRIEGIFTQNDMAFCIRNPRTDLWANAYGFSEIEMCLNSVLRMLWAEEYNARNFRQGSLANGIINFKGESYAPQQIEAFRRMWKAQVVGVENSHRVPIAQVPEGIEFINVQKGNKEMEYLGWLEYLLKIVSGMYQIDPSELNFDIGKANTLGSPMFESKQEWRIKYSKDKGLRPLLRFLARQVSKYVIEPLDSRLYLDFVGLDQVAEPDRINMIQTRVQNYVTVNEIRREEGYDPIPGGDTVLNPLVMQKEQSDVQMPPKFNGNPWAPWDTSGENDTKIYGKAPAIPLYLQPGGDEFEAEQQSAGMVPGMEGVMPGMPPGMPPGMGEE